jgi:hypothetical protein
MTAADDLTVIVRTAGERTVEAALLLLRAQVPASQISVVDERPFEKALRRTYELGIERSASWTMTLDADVLIREGAVAAFVAEARRMPAHYFQIEGRIFDKITGTYRQAGHRVYRTELLSRALPHIPPAGAAMRPEYATLQEMGRLGYPSRRVPLVVGLHDFEQHYRDLYRKAFVHARKHRERVPAIVERCLAGIEQDPDFTVILKGLYDGITRSDEVSIDTRRFETLLPHDWLEGLGLVEKTPIAPSEFAGGFAAVFDATLATKPPPRFDTCDEPEATKGAGEALWDGYRNRLAYSGWWQAMIGGVGGLLKRIGDKLEAVESRKRREPGSR